MLNESDELLTVAEIAARLKLNQQTVRNWIDRGELAGIRLGSRRVRVLSSELERFLVDSSSAVLPHEDELRKAVADAYTEYQLAGGQDQAAALRRLSRSAGLLARVLSP